jgi:hypothetical protein
MNIGYIKNYAILKLSVYRELPANKSILCHISKDIVYEEYSLEAIKLCWDFSFLSTIVHYWHTSVYMQGMHIHNHCTLHTHTNCLCIGNSANSFYPVKVFIDIS